MKILLLNPPNLEEVHVEATSVPLGLLHIKEFLLQHGCEVELVNLGHETTWSGVRERLAGLSYDMVGITAYTPQRLSVYRLAVECKEVNSGCSVVLGGPHATFLDIEILERIKAVDFIIRHEGEYTFLELVRTLGGGHGKSLDQVKGLTYRRSDVVVRTAARGAIEDLSALPPLRYSKEDVDDFQHSKGLTFSFKGLGTDSRVACIINSRGCNNSCLFCCNGTYWTSQKYYSPEYVFNNIKYFYEEFNIKMFDFSDDDFLYSQAYVSSLCDLIIEANLDIHWWCAGRAQGLDGQLLLKMKKAGCFMVSFGFESGSQKILDNIHKNVSLADALQSSRLTKEAGLMMRCTLTVGNPGEDEESIAETIDFLKKTRPDQIGLYLLKVYPGTPIYKRIKQEGGIGDDYWFDKGKTGLPFYTSENPLSKQIDFRNTIVASLEPHVVARHSDEVFHVKHLYLDWESA